jgi:hypothetical protein
MSCPAPRKTHIFLIDTVVAIDGAEVTLFLLLNCPDRDRYNPIMVIPKKVANITNES